MRYISRTMGAGEVATMGGSVGTFGATIRLRGHAANYHVRAGRTIDGPRLLGLWIEPDDGHEITSADLKLIPARRLAAAAVKVGGVNPDDDFEPDVIEYVEFDWDNFETPERAGKPNQPEQSTVGHPVQYGRKHYAEVARVAKKARADGTPGGARKAVAEWGGVSKQTADRWMRHARELRLLPRSNRAPRNTKGTKTR